MSSGSSYWLSNPRKEMLFIIGPLFLPVVVVAIFQDYFAQHTEVTPLWWLALVLCVDVGHVYSTLFRFYWDRPTLERYGRLLVVIPIGGFLVGFGLHLYDPGVFWRILAYVALYHFVRQQYGFMRLYTRKEEQRSWQRQLDAVTIYAATLYPVLYWHLHLTRDQGWFMPEDFLSITFPFADTISACLYGAILIAYGAKEIHGWLRRRTFNLPKNLLIVGTMVSWFAGIVYFRGDLTFTLMNVVAHGIPYMGLIWLYGEKKAGGNIPFGARVLAIFVVVLASLAYFEESLWDVLVWKDHPGLFPFFTSSGPIQAHWLLSIVVPLLVLPQVTHYVVDGFIWRFSKDKEVHHSVDG